MPDTHSTQNEHPWSRHSSSRRSISKRPASAVVRALGRTRRAVTAHAGAVLLRNVMEALGLVSMTDARASLKRAVGSRGSRRGNSLPRVLERSAWCALSGRPGGCTGGPGARDLARLRRAGATNGGDVGCTSSPSATSAGWTRALAAVEGTSYRAAGVDSVTLDFDATYVISVPKRRQGADRTYKRGLRCTRCCDAVLRRGLRRGGARPASAWQTGPSPGMKTFLTEGAAPGPDG